MSGLMPFPIQCVNHRHPGERRDPCLSAHAVWIPACAGMTSYCSFDLELE